MNKDYSEISSNDGQFGMFGLLCFLNYAEKNPNLASVTFGTDLTALGLNLTASEKLYPQFAGPWSDRTLSSHEIDYPVPPEYMVSSTIRDKLQITLKSYHEDTIFYLFYLYPNDLLQVAAAMELYNRDWRFHKEHKTWLTRIPGSHVQKADSFEQGTYWIFNHKNWRREAQELRIDYGKLEGRPTLV
jgi:CCR4-NOT transcription complex subunit 2